MRLRNLRPTHHVHHSSLRLMLRPPGRSVRRGIEGEVPLAGKGNRAESVTVRRGMLATDGVVDKSRIIEGERIAHVNQPIPVGMALRVSVERATMYRVRDRLRELPARPHPQTPLFSGLSIRRHASVPLPLVRTVYHALPAQTIALCPAATPSVSLSMLYEVITCHEFIDDRARVACWCYA